jgi:hypothetical protein
MYLFLNIISLLQKFRGAGATTGDGGGITFFFALKVVFFVFIIPSVLIYILGSISDSIQNIKQKKNEKEEKIKLELQKTPAYKEKMLREKNMSIHLWELTLFNDWDLTSREVPQNKYVDMYYSLGGLYKYDEGWDKVREDILTKNITEYNRLTDEPIEKYIARTGLKDHFGEMRGRWRDFRTFQENQEINDDLRRRAAIYNKKNKP